MIENYTFGIINFKNLNINLLSNINEIYGILYLSLPKNKEDIDSIISNINSKFIELLIDNTKYPEIITDIKKFDYIINNNVKYNNFFIKLPGYWTFDRYYNLLNDEKLRLKDLLETIL